MKVSNLMPGDMWFRDLNAKVFVNLDLSQLRMTFRIFGITGTCFLTAFRKLELPPCGCMPLRTSEVAVTVHIYVNPES